MSGLVKVRFLTDRTVQDGSGTTFKAGEVHELSEASARHWIDRKVAEPLADDAAETPEASEEAADVADAPKPAAKGKKR